MEFLAFFAILYVDVDVEMSTSVVVKAFSVNTILLSFLVSSADHQAATSSRCQRDQDG